MPHTMTGVINVPLKCGIRFTPPALIVVYQTQIEKTLPVKLRKRVMPIRGFRSTSYVNMHALDLQAKYMEDLEDLPFVYIEKMLWLLQYHLKGSSFNESLDIVGKKFSSNASIQQDLSQTQRKEHESAIMNEDFMKMSIKPGDPDFIYDKRVEFNVVKCKTDWDSSDDELDSFFDE